MQQSKTVTIGSDTYTITQLGAKKGRAVAVRLAKLLAPMAEGEDRGLSAALQNLSDADLEYVCDAFAALTSVKMERGSPQLDAIFDMHFAGKYGAMVNWLVECVKFNFADFLDELSVKLPSLKNDGTDPNPPSASQTTKTGTSGA